MLPKNPPKQGLNESSSLESVSSIPAEISSSNESADDPTYNPRGTKKEPSKIQKMFTTAKDKVVDALKPAAKPTSNKPKATKLKPAKAPAKMFKEADTKDKKKDERISEESFMIPVEPIKKNVKGKNAVKKGNHSQQSTTKKPAEKKNLRRKKNDSKAVNGQKDTVEKEKIVKIHVHKECTQAQKKLQTYLKAKIELKDTVCNGNLLPNVNDIIPSPSHKYKVIQLIANTAFGGVYKVQNVQSNEFYAMKVALKRGNEELRITVNSLLKLKSIHSHHFAEVLDHGKNQNFNFIVVTIAEKNVKKLIEEKRKLSIETAVVLSKQSLLAIDDFHKIGKLHRDIKEENILIGKPAQYHSILLSGFGFSTNCDTEGGAVTQFVTRTQKTAETQPTTAVEANKEIEVEFIIGSLKTGSLAGLTGKKQYRRHDFEAWAYMIAGWFGATLPWGDSNDLCQVVRMKEAFLLNTGTTRRELMEQLPVEIQTIIHHIFTLKNAETVDLKWALTTLDLILKVNNAPDEFMVDWDSTAAYREPPTSKNFYPAPKNEEPYYWLSKKATHFKLIYHGIIHWYGHFNPAASNRKNCVEFKCPVVGCTRKIYVADYDEEKIKQGQKAIGLHVASPHSCTVEERDGYKMCRE
uniref:Protein kinase domain-containing protein n=1 Tax=Panagrolaimus sp. PS1159 TaxID=55785 RepID=A0AC35GT00_9BILA